MKTGRCDDDVMSSDSELQEVRQRMSRIPRPVPPRRPEQRRQDDSEDSLRTQELPISRPLLYQPPDTRICYFYRDGHSRSAPVKIVVNRRAYPTFDVLKDELTRRVDGLPFGVRGIYTPAGRDSVRSLSDLQQDGRYVCTSVAARARGVDVERADALEGLVWRAGARPGSDGQRQLNAVIRGHDERSVQPAGSRRDAPDVVGRRLAWDTNDSTKSDKSTATATSNDQLTPRSHKKIVVLCHGETIQKHTLLLYKRTSQTFEQVLADLSGMFKTPVNCMFTADGAQVVSRFCITQCS